MSEITPEILLAVANVVEPTIVINPEFNWHVIDGEVIKFCPDADKYFYDPLTNDSQQLRIADYLADNNILITKDTRYNAVELQRENISLFSKWRLARHWDIKVCRILAAYKLIKEKNNE